MTLTQLSPLCYRQGNWDSEGLGDNSDHVTHRKSRDSRAMSQLKSRALFTATTITAALGDISGLSRFHEAVSCSFSSPRASCPIPDTTCPLEGGDLEGWAKELQESNYSAASRFSSPNIMLLFPCSKSPEGLLWPQAHRDWVWWSDTAVDSHCARLGKECWLKMWRKLASQRAWTTKPCPADSRGALRACRGSCEPLAVRWGVAATCLHIASCDTQIDVTRVPDPKNRLGRGPPSKWYTRGRHPLDAHIQAEGTNKVAHLSSKSFIRLSSLMLSIPRLRSLGPKCRIWF